MAPEVLYADEALIALHKPAGLLSVPGRGQDKQDCLSSRVQAIYPDALVVHRLDMATSGLLLMARGVAMQRLLNAAFSQRQVHKRYVAVVTGLFPIEQGLDPGWHTIDLPIVVDWPNRPLRIIDATHGQPSVTHVRCLAHDVAQHTSRLELEPITGRSHQLRVHLQAAGHPILGDALYAPATVKRQSPRLLLHASSLKLDHPLSGLPLHFNCPAEF